MSAISFDDFVKKYRLILDEIDLANKDIIDDMLKNPEKITTINKDSKPILIVWSICWYTYHDINENMVEKYSKIGLEACENKNLEDVNSFYKWLLQELLYKYLKSKNYDLADNLGLVAIQYFDSDANFIEYLAKIFAKYDFKLAEKYYLMLIKDASKDKVINIYYSIALLSNDIELTEKHLLKAIDLGDGDSMHLLAQRYKANHCYDIAEQYYLMSIEKGNIHAMNNMALMYSSQGNKEGAEKYLLMAIEHGNTVSLYCLGELYFQQNKLSDAKKYLLMCLEKNEYFTEQIVHKLINIYIKTNSIDELDSLLDKYIIIFNFRTYRNIGLHFFKKNDYDLAEKYFLKCFDFIDKNQDLSQYINPNLELDKSQEQKIDKDDDLEKDQNFEEDESQEQTKREVIKCFQNTISSLIDIYIRKKQYDLAEKFCHRGLDSNVPASVSNMIRIYKDLKQEHKIDEFCSKYLLHEDLSVETLNEYETFVNNPMKFYYKLSNLSQHKVVADKIQELKKIKHVRNYINKINILAKDGDCPICLESTKLIPRECAHSYCFKCYIDYDKCGICND